MISQFCGNLTTKLMRRKLKLTVVTSRRTANEYRTGTEQAQPPETAAFDSDGPVVPEQMDLSPGVRSAIESLIAMAKDKEGR